MVSIGMWVSPWGWVGLHWDVGVTMGLGGSPLGCGCPRGVGWVSIGTWVSPWGWVGLHWDVGVPVGSLPPAGSPWGLCCAVARRFESLDQEMNSVMGRILDVNQVVQQLVEGGHPSAEEVCACQDHLNGR